MWLLSGLRWNPWIQGYFIPTAAIPPSSFPPRLHLFLCTAGAIWETRSPSDLEEERAGWDCCWHCFLCLNLLWCHLPSAKPHPTLLQRCSMRRLLLEAFHKVPLIWLLLHPTHTSYIPSVEQWGPASKIHFHLSSFCRNQVRVIGVTFYLFLLLLWIFPDILSSYFMRWHLPSRLHWAINGWTAQKNSIYGGKTSYKFNSFKILAKFHVCTVLLKKWWLLC